MPRRAFTLMDLLICVGLIAVLLAILLPAIAAAREAAGAARCQCNLRTLAIAFTAYAAENSGRLPGNYYDGAMDWLGVSAGFERAPQAGTIWPYLRRAEAYRCPSQQPGTPGSRAGSNGRFDYSAVLLLAGAPLARIHATATFTRASGAAEAWPTPLIVEEDPAHWLNGSLDGGWCNLDRIAATHHHAGHYAAIDGSVQRIETAGGDAGETAWNWTINGRSAGTFPVTAGEGLR